MFSSGRPERTRDDGVAVDAEPACVELVPVIPNIHWSRVPDQQMSRADFVTQLIATAEQVPQTRSFRRATPADARAAYRAGLRQVEGAGTRTRQTI
jgi:hypothetical protein